VASPSERAPDWERLTEQWVRDGVILDTQRDPLLERLRAVPAPRPGGGAFGEAAVMGLVMVGVLLVTSSFVVALALFEADEEVGAVIVAALGLLQGAAGVTSRFALHRAVGHGIGSAGIVVFCSALLTLGLMDPSYEPFCLVVGVFAFLVTSVLAVADGGRGLAASAGFGIVGPALSQIGDPVSDGVLGFVCLAHTVLVSAGTVASERLELPARVDVLAAQTPFAAVVAAIAILAHRALLFTGSNGQEWESAVLLGLYGGLVMIAGWAAGSRFTLVSGLGVLLVAQIPVLWAFGSAYLGIAVLGIEGITLIGAAVLALVVRARVEERSLPGS
jgi:hypothetical protein